MRYPDGSGNAGGTAGQRYFQEEKAAGGGAKTRRGTGYKVIINYVH